MYIYVIIIRIIKRKRLNIYIREKKKNYKKLNSNYKKLKKLL
jgi:hypothetical protein